MAQHGPFTHPAPLPSPQPHFATHIMWKVAKPGCPMGRVHPSNPWGSKRERSPMIPKSIMNESNECLENLKSLNIFMDFFLIHPKFMFFGYPKGLAHCFPFFPRNHPQITSKSSNSIIQLQWVNKIPTAQQPTLGAPDKHATPLLQGRRSLPQFFGNIKKTTQHHATDIATQMVERCWKHLNLCALESFFNFTLPNRICRLKDSRSPDPRRHTAYIPQSYASGGVSWIQPWQSLEMDWGVEDVAFESICSFNQWNFLPHP